MNLKKTARLYLIVSLAMGSLGLGNAMAQSGPAKPSQPMTATDGTIIGNGMIEDDTIVQEEGDESGNTKQAKKKRRHKKKKKNAGLVNSAESLKSAGKPKIFKSSKVTEKSSVKEASSDQKTEASTETTN